MHHNMASALDAVASGQGLILAGRPIRERAGGGGRRGFSGGARGARPHLPAQG